MTFYKILCVFALTFLSGSLWSAEPDVPQKASSGDAKEGTNAVPAEVEKSVDPKFERYKTIVDRMPFGPEPVNFNPDAPGTSSGGDSAAVEAASTANEVNLTQEEQKIIASVRVSALNVTPSGKIAVGFTDSSRQPVGTYYLKVGESRDGWTVKSADAHEMKVTFEKDGVEATLALGEGSGDAKPKGGGGQIRSQVGRLNRAGLLRPAPSAAPVNSLAAAGGSAFARLRAQRAKKEAEQQAEAERQAAAAVQAKADRERAAAEREKAEAERQAAAAEREQQRQALLQIQEELRRAREEKAQQRNEDAAAQNADSAQGVEAAE